jgi:hypothetical protein
LPGTSAPRPDRTLKTGQMLNALLRTATPAPIPIAPKFTNLNPKRYRVRTSATQTTDPFRPRRRASAALRPQNRVEESGLSLKNSNMRSVGVSMFA